VPLQGPREIKRLNPQVKVPLLTIYKKKLPPTGPLDRLDGFLLKEDADTELFAGCQGHQERRRILLTSPELIGTPGFSEKNSSILTNRERKSQPPIGRETSLDIAEL
jgi:hypothetical protein